MWMVRQIRPDVLPHVVIENSPDIEEPHRGVILRMIGITGDQLNVFNAEKVSGFVRRRTFAASRPAGCGPSNPARRRGKTAGGGNRSRARGRCPP